jgi:hypothetical protein
VIDGKSVTSIGSYTFYSCPKLKSVTIPAGVKLIVDFAFYENSSVENVTIPNTIETIGKYAFYNCTISVFLYRSKI